MSTHEKHISWYSGKDFGYIDEHGNQHDVYDTTDDQKKLLDEMIHLSCGDHGPDYNVHELYHNTPEYKNDGWEHMQKMDEYVKEHPEIKVFGFDDDYFMNSAGYIIPHKSKYEHMGHTVMLTTQGGQPYTFFLYPEHAKRLLKALTEAIADLNTVPRNDVSSPNYLRGLCLHEQLLNTIHEDKGNPDTPV